MNDEIKEIISKRKQKIELNKSLNVQGYYDKEDELLLDYITNLQEENERTKLEWVLIKSALDTAQSRIDKAINKVQYIIDIGFDYDGYNDVDNLKILVDELVDLARQMKNILNGRSDK